MDALDSLEFAIIQKRYLLITFIPYFVDDAGEVWLTEGWHRDLQRHTEYLRDLNVVAPRFEYHCDNKDLKRLERPVVGGVSFVALKAQNSLKQAILSLPHTIVTIWREVKMAAIVHSNIVGWPFPIGWIANAWALVYRRKLIVVVESAPWRNPQVGLKAKLNAWLTERLGRFFMRRADLAIATQAAYLKTLRNPMSRGVGIVSPASWVNQEEVLTPEALQYSWEVKRHISPVSLLFAGRMQPDKGIQILLAAIDILKTSRVEIQIDFIGEGVLREICCEYVSSVQRPLVAHVLQPVHYGEEFLTLLQKYHAVVVPSMGDEQPRILFDAFTQGVPVIASDTDGIRDHVSVDSGWLFAKGDPQALAIAILEAVANPRELERRGSMAHGSAKKMTHREMHRQRSIEIAKL